MHIDPDERMGSQVAGIFTALKPLNPVLLMGISVLFESSGFSTPKNYLKSAPYNPQNPSLTRFQNRGLIALTSKQKMCSQVLLQDQGYADYNAF